MPTLDDKEIIIRIKNGEIDHFTYLVKKYTRQILNFTSKNIRNRDDSEDILQNTFLSLYKAINRFDEERPLLPYLYQIVRNEIKMYWRSKKITVTLDEKIIAKEKVEILDSNAIEAQLKKLPKEQRKVLKLISEGYSYKEIAKFLKRPINTVRTIIRRARLKMLKLKFL